MSDGMSDEIFDGMFDGIFDERFDGMFLSIAQQSQVLRSCDAHILYELCILLSSHSVYFTLHD